MSGDHLYVVQDLHKVPLIGAGNWFQSGRPTRGLQGVQRVNYVWLPKRRHARVKRPPCHAHRYATVLRLVPQVIEMMTS